MGLPKIKIDEEILLQSPAHSNFFDLMNKGWVAEKRGKNYLKSYYFIQNNFQVS